MQKQAFDPNAFRDLYGDESVNKDIRYVEQRKADFAKTGNNRVVDELTEGDIRKLAERAEYEVFRGINAGGWIPMMKAFKTSDFDDIHWGVDMILEFQNREVFGHIGLGIDVTFAQDIYKKFARIKTEIENFDGEKNRLARAKYYESSKLGHRGELFNLARVVIAVDLPMLEDIARAKNAMHTNHIARHEILLELEQQLAVFADYAHRVNKLALEPI